MIVMAAIKQDGIVYTGRRHADVIANMRLKGIVWNPTEIQGFVTYEGEFLDRKQALQHFIESGQESANPPLRHNVGLFSEDLY